METERVDKSLRTIKVIHVALMIATAIYVVITITLPIEPVFGDDNRLIGMMTAALSVVAVANLVQAASAAVR